MRRFGHVTALALVLASCGGEDGGGVTAPPIIAPAPTPSPSPTASVTPPVTLADHFTFDPFVATIRVRSLVLNGDAATSRPVALTTDLARDRTTAELTWQPQDGSYIVRQGAETWSFGPKDRNPGDTNHGLTYIRFSRQKPVTPEGFGALAADLVPAKTGAYVWVGSLSERSNVYRLDYTEEEVRRHLVTGQATAPDRVPTSGSVRAAFGFNATLPVRYYIGTVQAQASADVDYAARTIRATFDAVETTAMNGNAPVTVTLTLDARWDASTARIEGTVRSADGTYTGAATGRFYGPDGRDWGMAMTLTSTDPLRGMAGHIVSAR